VLPPALPVMLRQRLMFPAMPCMPQPMRLRLFELRLVRAQLNPKSSRNVNGNTVVWLSLTNNDNRSDFQEESFMFFHDQQMEHVTVDSNTTRKVLAHSDQIMYAKVMFAKAQQGEIPLHKHVHEQITYVLQGSFQFMIDDSVAQDVQIVRVGDSIHFPSGVLHGCIPLEDGGILLDAFTPARGDFL
jgi:quercetin dioxygenase-like cupin family protein